MLSSVAMWRRAECLVFAVQHVLGCVQRLDTERDHQLALELSQQEGYLHPGAEIQFTKPVFCPDGSACQRRDYKHFEQLIHPPVNVCSCGSVANLSL